MVIDEIQLAPELLRAIKVLVDLDPRPGRFLLTGSSRILALRSLPDALPGRMEVIEFWPFSQGKIKGGPDLFVDAAFRHGAALEHSSPMRKRDYLELAVIGGFPETVRRTPRRREAFFSSYLTTLIERDVLGVSSIERQGDMLRLLSLLARRVSRLLVPSTLAGQAGIPRTTLVRYLELLATVFLIKTVPAWSSGQTARAMRTPPRRAASPGRSRSSRRGTSMVTCVAAVLANRTGRAGSMRTRSAGPRSAVLRPCSTRARPRVIRSICHSSSSAARAQRASRKHSPSGVTSSISLRGQSSRATMSARKSLPSCRLLSTGSTRRG
jgi:hypothetical protein